MRRGKHFILSIIVLSVWNCTNDTEEVKESKKEQPQVVEPVESESVTTNDDWKEMTIGDSIRIEVPQGWQRVETERFSLKDDCENQFCENVVIYTMDDVNQYTRMGLGETFIKSLSGSYNDFKLIHSEISTPDSSRMSFDYLLTSQGLRLGGTTYIYIRGGQKAVIFSFMGYNGANGDYVTVRETITKIVESIEFK